MMGFILGVTGWTAIVAASVAAAILWPPVGSVIGGVIASLLGTGDIFELNVLGFIVAVVAAILLLGIAEGLSGNRTAR
jgi:uncharacterized membrane protein YeaQ/YmgE (transglycosylase-associated protein family)